MQRFTLEEAPPPSQKLPFYPCMAIVQARMSSTRLKGKVLKEVLHRPLLFYLVERLRRIRGLDGIVIATSQDTSDDPIAAFCSNHALYCIRGQLEDVLARYYAACEAYDAEVIIRITADCPLIDPLLIEKGLAAFAAHYDSLDYLSNTIERTFARGMDFEIMRKSALEKAYFEAKTAFDKEHVTPYIISHPELFRQACLVQKESSAAFRLTVDQEEDFDLIRRLLEALYPEKPEFTLADIVQIMKIHPKWADINAHVVQK